MPYIAIRTPAAVAVAGVVGAVLFAAPAPAGAVPGLVGRSFTSTSVLPMPIPGGGPLTITFGEKDRVSLSAGCNRMMGTATARDGRLHFSRLASTMMACPPPRDRADEWASAFTKMAPHYRVSGTALTLNTASERVELREERTAPPR
ncbi:hypothetical protein GCM10010528_20370 [Gordonia defluvii]|uniref:DUF306 domain-containing protein n=1 Tax=Gordonia defluvii TaxID=283718 RepID=A0ABP6LCP7_9ACTN|nr:META domain-containing protein [Gordonia sp. UBA5067]